MHTRTITAIALLLAAAATGLTACTDGGQPAGPLRGGADSDATPTTTGENAAMGSPGTTAPEPIATNIVWKRARVVERDLMRALSLSRDELCSELDAVACVEAHLSPLGGNEPFERAQYAPIAEPSSITPMVLERLVMGACAKRVAMDLSGQAEVFTHFNLSAPPRIGDIGFLTALDQQHGDLFRKLLSRNPEPEELQALRELARTPEAPATGAELATLGCFVIGTHAEFAFL